MILALTGCDAPMMAPAESPTPIAVLTSLEDASYAGRLEDAQTFIAIVTDGSGMRAYVCDDEVNLWFDGAVSSLPTVVTAADGSELYVHATETGLAGAVTRADGTELSFDAPRTAESALYRGETTVGSDTFLGGWIRLPDGEQRGVLLVNDSGIASRLEGSRVIVPASSAGRTVTRLTPVRFDPGGAMRRTANVAIDLSFVGLGDSYGAGDGAPEVPGVHGVDGFATGAGEREEVWDSDAATTVPEYTVSIPPPPARTREARPTQARLARACHRSGRNGFQVAVDTLESEWPGVDFDAESFACSGAETEHLLESTYEGTGGSDGLAGWSQIPQLDQLDVSLTARPRDIDGISMSIGGNDMGFVPIMVACLADPACAGAGSIAQRILASGAEGVGAGYDAIGDEVERRGYVRPRDLFLTAYPSPVRTGATSGTGSTLCPSVTLSGWPGSGLLETVAFTSAEIAFADGTVVGTLNREVRAAAARNGFRVVDGHLDRFALHGWCSADPWVGTIRSGLDVQGADVGNFQVFDALAYDVFVGVPLTGGIAHPTAAGFRDGYGPAIADSFRAIVQSRVRPSRPTRLRVAAQTLNGAVVVRWDDLASTETDYRVRVTRLPVSGTTGDASARDGGTSEAMEIVSTSAATEQRLDATGRAAWSVSVRACHTGTGVESCSTPSPAIRLANFPPAAIPTSLHVRNRFCGTACNPGQMLWSAVDDVAHLYYEVDVDGVLVATTSTFLEGTGLRFRVRSCNLTGCGPFSARIDAPQTYDTTGTGAMLLEQQCDALARDAREIGQPPGDPAGLCD